MRAARLTRRQAAGNRFSAGQPPVVAAIVRACFSGSTLATPTVIQPALSPSSSRIHPPATRYARRRWRIWPRWPNPYSAIWRHAASEMNSRTVTGTGLHL